MFVLSAEHIQKSYTGKALLEDVSLIIDEKDKVGLIGVNGTGKSTLLKILAGLEEADQGSVNRPGGVTVGYLPQNPVFERGMTVLEQVLDVYKRQARYCRSGAFGPDFAPDIRTHRRLGNGADSGGAYFGGRRCLLSRWAAEMCIRDRPCSLDGIYPLSSSLLSPDR